MDELQLQSWERELAAWRRRLLVSPSPALDDEVVAAAAEISRMRSRMAGGLPVSGERVLRHFSRLRALWEYLVQGDEVSRTTPA